MSYISLSIENNISKLTIDDGKVNAFSAKLLKEFNDVLSKIPKDTGALCILGRPGFFTAGFDINCLQSGSIESIKEMTTLGFQLLIDLFSFPRPIVMGCTGHAIGLGVFLLCCADYRIGAEGAFKCHANEVVNGMVIPKNMLCIAEHRLLPTHVNRLLLNGEPYPIQNTVGIGLLDDMVKPNMLQQACIERAALLNLCQHPFYEQTKRSSRKEVIKMAKLSLKELTQ